MDISKILMLANEKAKTVYAGSDKEDGRVYIQVKENYQVRKLRFLGST